MDGKHPIDTRADALGRRAAAALRTDVERRTDVRDVDGALRDTLRQLHEGTAVQRITVGNDGDGDGEGGWRRMRRTAGPQAAWLGAAAAIVVVAVGAALFLVLRDDGGTRVVPADTAPPTVDPAPASTIPTDVSTTPPASTAPASTETVSTEAIPTEPASTKPTPVDSTTPALRASDVDALAGLVPPAPLDPAGVPALLPAAPVADPSVVRLSGFSTPIEAVTGLRQTWASADGRLLSISTDIGGSVQRTGEAPVDVWPWDNAAVVTSMSDGFAELILRDPAGVVSVWGAAFTDDELIAIARGLTLTSGGWRLGNAAPSDLVLVHEGWMRTSFATRSMLWDDDGRLGEVLITLGMPDTVRSPFFPGVEATVVDSINGAPALVTVLPTGSAISWSPAPDVVVLIGISGTTDEVIELARSMAIVDDATWAASGVDATSAADGCNSYFFC